MSLLNMTVPQEVLLTGESGASASLDQVVEQRELGKFYGETRPQKVDSRHQGRLLFAEGNGHQAILKERSCQSTKTCGDSVSTEALAAIAENVIAKESKQFALEEAKLVRETHQMKGQLLALTLERLALSKGTLDSRRARKCDFD